VRISLNSDNSEKKAISVIAEEVEVVFPEVVAFDPNDKEKTMAVDYGRIAAILIEAVKEQQEQIDKLKSEVAKLKKSSK
jgi:hypothetical protein